MVKEATIVRAIVTYLNSLPNCYARKTHGGPHSAGWPDIVGCYRGALLAIEVKRPGKPLTRLQTHELEKWSKAGAVAGLASSVEDVEKMINPL